MKVKKVAVVTFHRAHNFGSVLQTYALQEYVKELGKEAGTDIEYTVIDFYTEEQEELYKVYKSGINIKNIIKNVFVLQNAKALKMKHRKFNDFISENFNVTERYRNTEEMKLNVPSADYYISGSDQIWNVRAKDFADVYYLDFVNQGKKISYAASFGPLKIDWEQYDKQKYTQLLQEYNAISVRECGSADNVEYLTGDQCSINVDPTLLLASEQWRKIQSDVDYKNGQYILMYCLEPSKQQLEMADAISKKLKLPIVILRYNNKNDMFNHYVKKYDSGPKDFLAYIDHAALVLSSSFHGTAFSLIYHKPFYVFNGMKDNRISSILLKTGMTERSLECFEEIERVTLDKPDDEAIEALLNEERNASRMYLRRALEII